MMSLETALEGKPRLVLRAGDLERLLQGKDFAAPEDRRPEEDDLVEVGGRIVGRARPLEGGRRWRLKRIILDPREDQPSA